MSAPDEPCPHDDDPHSCPPCQRAAGRIPSGVTERPEVEFSFTARFDGDCSGCHLPIHVGQRAARWTDGRTRHADCGPS